MGATLARLDPILIIFSATAASVTVQEFMPPTGWVGITGLDYNIWLGPWSSVYIQSSPVGDSDSDLMRAPL
jgi:hypothetical protein